MKKWMYLVLAVLISGGLFLFEREGDAADQEINAAKINEREIEKYFKDYSEQFSKHDAKEMAELWSQDAIYINPATGAYVEGREAFAEEFKHWFEDKHSDKIVFTVKKIVFPKPDESIAIGTFQVTSKDGNIIVENAFRAVLTKEDNKWLFDEFRQISLDTAPTNYEKLKELAWLEGDWIDTDEDVNIETITKWDKNKNFLIQNFTFQVFNSDVLEGKQIIAWDPVEKVIRSWTFDSDGGFGQGTWYNKGNSWYVKNSYTLANGDTASAINIYTKVNDNEYTWASVGRDVNGQILPNIEPIKIVKNNKVVQP